MFPGYFISIKGPFLNLTSEFDILPLSTLAPMECVYEYVKKHYSIIVQADRFHTEKHNE